MNKLKEGIDSKLELRNRARQLRADGFSYRQISRELEISRSTIFYWVKHVELTPKQKNIQIQKRWDAQKKGAAVKKNNFLLRAKNLATEAMVEAKKNIHDPLWVAGVTIYWAEGAKQKPWNVSAQVKFTNTDPDAHLIFRSFFKKYFKDDESLFVYALYIHDNADVIGAVMYWADKLNIPQQELKVYFKKSKDKTNRHNQGKIYKGILCMSIKRSAEYNRIIANWACAMVTLLPHSGIV